MKFSAKQTSTLPGITGTLRVARMPGALPRRVKRGDIVVIDHTELDLPTARSWTATGVAAVINARPMVSGRYPNLGPEHLAASGVVLLEDVGLAGVTALGDGRNARIVDGAVYDGEQRLAEGRVVDLDGVRSRMEHVRTTMHAQLDTFTHTSAELLRREQESLLHRNGLPDLRARLAGCPVVVACEGDGLERQVRSMKWFVKEQRPGFVAVGMAADRLRRRGIQPDVVVVAPGEELPSAKALKAARDVVVCAPSGGSASVDEALKRIGVTPRHFATVLAAPDAALMVADGAEPELVVVAGETMELSDVLDGRSQSLAGAYLARLAVNAPLLDAAAVPRLYSGRVKRTHAVFAMLLCVAAVLASIATTDVGQRWEHDVDHGIHHVWDEVGL